MTAPDHKLPIILVVAVALIDVDGRVLIAQRPEGKKMAGLWEFPGGKLEQGETFEKCLARELREELAIEVALGQLFEEITHEYPERTVRLRFFLCRLAKGRPRAIGCAAFEWSTRDCLAKRDFPSADKRLLRRLVDTESLWA